MFKYLFQGVFSWHRGILRFWLINFNQILTVYFLTFFIVCLLIRLIIDDYNKPVVSDVDQIINDITEKKSIKYISNGVELKTNFTEHYLDILDMEKGKLFDRDMILIQIKKQHSYYQEDMAVGYKTRCNSKDILLAETYILDNYNYLVYLNWWLTIW